MGKRATIGDVFEINTERGLSYAQLSHKHKLYGYLLRILPGFYATRPMDIRTLVQEKDNLQLFAHVPRLVSSGILLNIGNTEVPEFAGQLPLFRFRQEGFGPSDWFLWNGEDYHRLGRELPEQYRNHPNLCEVSAEYFLDLVSRGRTNRDLPESCITGEG